MTPRDNDKGYPGHGTRSQQSPCPFVGRQSQISQVAEDVATHRLVTLTGAGGCGTTRLPLQVAERSTEEHPDGIWWVDLARLSDGLTQV